jgi:hypothetical protein
MIYTKENIQIIKENTLYLFNIDFETNENNKAKLLRINTAQKTSDIVRVDISTEQNRKELSTMIESYLNIEQI